MAEFGAVGFLARDRLSDRSTFSIPRLSCLSATSHTSFYSGRERLAVGARFSPEGGSDRL